MGFQRHVLDQNISESNWLMILLNKSRAKSEMKNIIENEISLKVSSPELASDSGQYLIITHVLKFMNRFEHL